MLPTDIQIEKDTDRFLKERRAAEDEMAMEEQEEHILFISGDHFETEYRGKYVPLRAMEKAFKEQGCKTWLIPERETEKKKKTFWQKVQKWATKLNAAMA